MSLVVWLPLDGDLRNLGTMGDYTFSLGSAGINNEGKIGKCYKFTSLSSSGINLATGNINNFFTNVVDNKSFSMCGWLKTSESYAPIIYLSYGIRLAGGAKPLIGISNKTNSITVNSNVTTNDGKWHHICGTYSSSTRQVKIYVDGINTGTGTLPGSDFVSLWRHGIFIGRNPNDSQANSTYFLVGSLNDVRIYDHCLSAAEVHEIAQGLVLHYKLNGNGFIDNIIPGTDNWLSWYKGSRWTASGNVLTYSAGSVSWVDADSPCIPWTDVENKTLTVSVDLRSDDFNYSSGSGFSLCFVRKASGPTATSYSSRRRECTPIHKTAGTVSTNWTTYSYTYTNFTDANFSNTFNGGGGDWFGLYLWNYTNKSIQVRNIKVEINNKPTSWCPNAADALYSTLGLGEAIISDSSGYGHNGTIINSLTTLADTPRYSRCTHMSATNQKIKISGLTTSGFSNSYTIAWWGKCATFSGRMHWGFSNGVRLNGIYNGTLWNTGDGSNNPLYKPGTTTQVTTPSTGVWHHFAMIGDGTNCKVYLDGNYWGIAKTYKSISGTSIYLNGWNSSTSYSNSDLSLSDFRIYCTALLDTDIKLLYKMGMRVDNLGGVHTFEYIEDEEEKNTLQGLLKTNEIEEYNGIAKIKKNKGWLSPNFIEM